MNKIFDKAIYVFIISIVVVSGCQKNAHFDSSPGRVLGAILTNDQQYFSNLGAYHGTTFGNEIKNFLGIEDQERMQVATKETLITGETTAWKNPAKKISGKVEVVRLETQNKAIDIPVLKGRVKHIPPLDIIGSSYLAKKRSNVRGGAGSDYIVIDTLAKGKIINVVGKVQNKPWYMISENGAGSGFVHSSLLKISIDKEIIKESSIVVGNSDIEKKSVKTSSKCRIIKQFVTLEDGTEKEEEIRACKGLNGWVVG